MKKNKVTILGAGMVGSTTAYSLIASKAIEELALIDINEKLCQSQVMDLQHSVPFWGYTKVKIGDYTDMEDSQIAIITCGSAQKVGETRLDLLKKNASIIKGIISEIFNHNPDIIVIVVTNPVDILTNIAIKMFPEKKNQIFGSGTMLDTGRFRFLLGEKTEVNPNSLHAYIVGEHGDSEVPLWSTAMVGNTPLDQFYKLSEKEKDDIFNKAKNAAYAIIEGKQSTYYAVAAGLVTLVDTILYNKKTVFTVSHPLNGMFGINDVSLSLPRVVGAKGILRDIEITISSNEKDALRLSAKKLSDAENNLL